MKKDLHDRFCDERLQWPPDLCIHCGRYVTARQGSREHIPSKCLLQEPHPDSPMTMRACRQCNAAYAHDEEYLAAILAAVLAGSTDPDKQNSAKAARRFRRQTRLRTRIDAARTEARTLFGEVLIVFQPEYGRVNRVVVKNARAHALYDLELPRFDTPDHVVIRPLSGFTETERTAFEMSDQELLPWAEFGTRMFLRQAFATHPASSDMRGPWVIVQENVYRYLAMEIGDGTMVRSVIHEYLATEVVWSTRHHSLLAQRP